MTLEEYCKDTMNIQEDVLRLRIENERLQKENAELKEQLNFKTRFVKGEKAIDQLAQAKEIIEELYDTIPASHTDLYKDVMEKAKQFLWGKEIEK